MGSSTAARPAYPDDKKFGVDSEKKLGSEYLVPHEDDIRISLSSDLKHDSTHRRLKSRHIQLIGIGGSIGTVLYVQIGKALLNGGPGSLFIAFSFWCTVVLAVTLCMAEMVTYLPISSPFIRFAGRFVDEAMGFATGWNFFIFEAFLVPFEVTACNFIIRFWTDAVPTAAIIVIIIVLYALVNLLAVKWYGEAEFWAAISKVLLIIGLVFFTFVVMLGGTQRATASASGTGKNRCLIQAAFTIAGPDYVSMAAGEAENPRVVMPRAYNAVFYRLTAFFILGSLCVGILVPYNDKDLIAAFANSKPGAAASPYVVAMNRLGIKVLPHIVNATVLTAAFSAGNSYVYCASRSLYGLALEGKAPRFLVTCTSTGVPIYCVGVVLVFALLSFLQLSSNAAVVLNWFVSLGTASQLINFSAVCVTYICFHRACKAQGIDRDTLPYKAWFMPYAAYYALAWTSVMAIVGGYTVFLPGQWNIPDFLFSYTMVAVYPILYFGYKYVRQTKIHAPEEVDLHGGLDEIEEYQANYIPTPPKNGFEKILDKLFG
ncbi:General amino acid permease AGP2 [Cladobotryum mycophilum]|uniref:General amino acid permease AGP2 n=1 Tax=Cladobotryum mycophilum TaxID=491253 RepID=A0ABR0SBY6_9HYPO